MTYSTDLLLTTGECNSALSFAEREKINLEYRVATLGREKTEMAVNGPEIDQKLSILNAEILGYQTAYSTEPDGPGKTGIWEKLQLALSKQRSLLKRDQNYGNVATLTLELELVRAQKEIAELQTFMQEVTSRKAGI